MNTQDTIKRYEEDRRLHIDIAKMCKKQKRYHDNHWHRGYAEALRRMIHDIKKSFFYKGQNVILLEGLFGDRTLMKAGETVRIVRMDGHPNPNEDGIYVTQIGRNPDGDKYSTYVNPDDIRSAL